MAHEFGGEWSEKKLQILEDYLGFYTQALKNQHFKLHYVDAFAGSGTHAPKANEKLEGFWEEDQKEYSGSVRRALEVTPPFETYHFNEIDPMHISELRRIKKEFPDRDIRISEMDANSFVPQFCRSMGVSDRAVLFLDPYATQVDWETVRAVAKSKKVDLWLLFPISALARMTPRDKGSLPIEWKATLNRLLGTSVWEDQIYQPPSDPVIHDMFEDAVVGEAQRVPIDALGRWVRDRLSEEFAFVSEGFELKNRGNLLFLFFFAVSNPEPKVHALAYKVLKSMMKREMRGR